MLLRRLVHPHDVCSATIVLFVFCAYHGHNLSGNVTKSISIESDNDENNGFAIVINAF